MPVPNMKLRYLFVFLFTRFLFGSFNSPPNCYLTPVGMQMPALFQHHAELPGKHCRRRKARTVFSDSQLSGLEKRFEIQRYLSTPERVELATALSLSETQVLIQAYTLKVQRQSIKQPRAPLDKTQTKQEIIHRF